MALKTGIVLDELHTQTMYTMHNVRCYPQSVSEEISERKFEEP